MNQKQNMALVKLARKADPSFIHFLIGWMGNNHHEEMAKCARVNLLEYTEEGKDILADFDATLDQTLEV